MATSGADPHGDYPIEDNRYFYGPSWNREAWLELHPDGTVAFMLKIGEWYGGQRILASTGWSRGYIDEELRMAREAKEQGSQPYLVEATFEEVLNRVPRSYQARALRLCDANPYAGMDVGKDSGC